MIFQALRIARRFLLLGVLLGSLLIAGALRADMVTPEEFDHLSAQLQDADPANRAAAARALGGVVNQRIVDLLFPLLQDDSPAVRAATAGALAETCNVRVLEPLRQMLGDTSPEVRAAAAYALGTLGALPHWLPDVPGDWQAYRDDPHHGDAATRAKMQAAFQQVGWDTTREALAALLTDAAPLVRGNAAVALLQFNDPRARPLIADTLHADNPLLRARMLTVLDGTHAAEVVDSALALLPGESDVSVLSALAHLLGASQDQRAVAPLIAALPKKNPAARGAFLQALAALSDPRALETMLAYQQDPDAAVRETVATALGKSTDSRAVDALVKLLSDKVTSVRMSALHMLEQNPDPRAEPGVCHRHARQGLLYPRSGLARRRADA